MSSGRGFPIQHSAARRYGTIIIIVYSFNTKTATRKCLPQEASVSTTIAVRIGLNDGITGAGESRVTWLQRECTHEQIKEYNVARRLAWIEQVI